MNHQCLQVALQLEGRRTGVGYRLLLLAGTDLFEDKTSALKNGELWLGLQVLLPLQDKIITVTA